jgi:hypothetical protein
MDEKARYVKLDMKRARSEHSIAVRSTPRFLFYILASLAIALLCVHLLHSLAVHKHLQSAHFHAVASRTLWFGCDRQQENVARMKGKDPVPAGLGPSDIPANTTVLLSYTNKAYSEWMLNWAMHAKSLNVSMLVISLDDFVTELCTQHRIPHISADSASSMASEDSLADENFRKDRAGKFRAMGHVSAAAGQGCRHYE